MERRMKRFAMALLVLSPVLVAGCSPKEPEAETKPTTNNPQAYPGMENAKNATLRPGGRKAQGQEKD
jgi:hypothetical protein